MIKPGLSKSLLLANRQCPRRLWLQVYRPELAGTFPDLAPALSTATKRIIVPMFR